MAVIQAETKPMCWNRHQKWSGHIFRIKWMLQVVAYKNPIGIWWQKENGRNVINKLTTSPKTMKMAINNRSIWDHAIVLIAFILCSSIEYMFFSCQYFLHAMRNQCKKPITNGLIALGKYFRRTVCRLYHLQSTAKPMTQTNQFVKRQNIGYQCDTFAFAVLAYEIV